MRGVQCCQERKPIISFFAVGINRKKHIINILPVCLSWHVLLSHCACANRFYFDLQVILSHLIGHVMYTISFSFLLTGFWL